MVEHFFFSVVCATAFTAGLCHWLLDLGYKYRFEDTSTNVVDFVWVFLLAAVISVYYLIRKKRIRFDMALVLLCQGLMLAAVIDYHNGQYPEVPYAYIIPIAYIVGKLVVTSDVKIANFRMIVLYFAMAIGIFITTLLDFLMDFKYASVYGWQTESWIGFWIAPNPENRCTMEFGFILISAATGYLLYASTKNIYILVFVIQANLIIQRLVIKVSGRENRLILPLAIAFTAALYIFDHWKDFSVRVKTFVKRGIGVCVLAILLFILAFFMNIGGLHDKYEASNWSAGGGVLTNVRLSIDWAGFKAMIAHPLDDYNLHDGLPKSHSMLLEYGRAYDIAVWGILLLARVVLIKDAILLMLKKDKYSRIKYLYVPAFTAVNMYYSMEPNGYAHRYFWLVGLFLSGMIRGWLECDRMQPDDICISDISSHSIEVAMQSLDS